MYIKKSTNKGGSLHLQTFYWALTHVHQSVLWALLNLKTYREFSYPKQGLIQKIMVGGEKQDYRGGQDAQCTKPCFLLRELGAHKN